MADELPRQARDLLARARKGDGPTPDDRARVRASLLAAVATGEPPSVSESTETAPHTPHATPAERGAPQASTASSLATSALLKWGGLLLAGTLAGGLWLLRPPSARGLAVSEEPAGGSPQPTGNKFLIGTPKG
jgi:hypothetical protein